MLSAIEWNKGKPRILDQLQLPGKEAYFLSKDYKATGLAIKSMKLRGAPAIGVAAAFGMAQAVLASKARTAEELGKDLEKAGAYLKSMRPTAVNLAWGVDRMQWTFQKSRTAKVAILKDALVKEALEVQAEDKRLCDAIAGHGAPLIRDGEKVLTHCNTGSLATAGVGTALGVIKRAFEEGKKISVWVDETRPYFQGSRLTAFELKEARIPFTVITDSTAGLLMARKQVGLVIVGADRITAQGDVANKIGTFTLAVLCKEHQIPFYVAAPLSTVDMKTENGEDIVIEERSAEEVLLINGKSMGPKGAKAAHFAFDVTPNRYISAIITEAGLIRAPFKVNLEKAFASAGA